MAVYNVCRYTLAIRHVLPHNAAVFFNLLRFLQSAKENVESQFHG